MRIAPILAFFTLAAALAAPACDSSRDTAARVQPKALGRSTSAPGTATAAHVHDVACGCTLGKSCQNMIDVDGAWLPLEGDIDVGPMAFCGKTGLEAEVRGERRGDAFVATSFRLVETGAEK